MSRVVVDPVTRIEGHLRIEAEVDGGAVRDAWSSSTMVRGIELILKGRDPRDAPILVLLDLKLPKISGIDILRRIRAHPFTEHIPVVVLTTSDLDEDLVRAYGLGANSFVRKPVDFDAFQRAVERIALYWLVVNQPPPIIEREVA